MINLLFVFKLLFKYLDTLPKLIRCVHREEKLSIKHDKTFTGERSGGRGGGGVVKDENREERKKCREKKRERERRLKGGRGEGMQC